MIAACTNVGDCQCGICFYGLAYKMGHASVVRIEGALTDMYAKSGNMKDAYKVFEKKNGTEGFYVMLLNFLL